MPIEGERRVNKNDANRVAIYSAGQWYELPGAGGGRGLVKGDASQRGRLALALDPALNANNSLERDERPGNPLQKDWGASMLIGMDDQLKKKEEKGPGLLATLGRMAGGDDFQAYTQAASTFESSLMPVFSGSAVTQSEAQRFIKANLPVFSDSPETLKLKAKNRKMILNAAADIAGKPMPYPDVPIWGSNQQHGGQSAPAAAPASSQRPAPQQQQDNDPLRIR